MGGCSYHLLLCCLTALLTGPLLGQEQTPAQIAAELVEESCNGNDFTAFYLSIREKQRVNRRYPPWPNNDRYPPLPARQISWGSVADSPIFDNHTDTIPLYEDFWTNLFSAPAVDPSDWTWCVYLFSEQSDVHGCIVGNGTTWATPKFQRLGLLEKLFIRDVGPEIELPTSTSLMSLSLGVIDFVEIEGYASGNVLWNNALVTVNVNFRSSDGSAIKVGEYFILHIYQRITQFITDISGQVDGYLVAGQEKTLFCEVYGTETLLFIDWKLSGSTTDLTEEVHCDYPLRDYPCKDIVVHRHYDSPVNCNEHFFEPFRLSTIHMILDFRNPTINVTGEYVCSVKNNPLTGLQNKSIYIYVVFVEVFESTLNLGQQGGLRCSVKAPTDSNITVSHNNRLITTPFSGEDSNCDHTPQISTSTQPLEEGFTLFSVTIHICNVGSENIGTYKCEVAYIIPDDPQPQFASLSSYITISSDNEMASMESGLSVVAGVGIGIGVFLVSILLVATVTLFLFILVVKVSRQRALRRHSKHHLKMNVSFMFSPPHVLLDKDSAQSQPGSRLNHVEFLRSNLELHNQIGKGRFGKVMVASAYNIIPHLPSLNKVAVKMPLSNAPQNNEAMLTELEVMKQMDSHDNICNLLAYCTVENPVYIIMEYACHGNLKEYLDSCRETILQSGQPLFISRTYRNPVSIDPSSGLETTVPGYLSESDVRNFAFQIACALEHLETVEVVHCDLASRNILISEGFVLKIGDFGLSKKTSDEDNYQNIIDLDGIVAVKWVPPEALENKGFFFTSDVWSFAVIVWEIASYGSRPFAEHKIGVSLDRFIQFLRAGNRLPQPNGLSDSIYQTLLKCWSVEPNDRPSSTDLREFFQE